MVLDIAAGQRFSLFLDDHGKVYCMGPGLKKLARIKFPDGVTVEEIHVGAEHCGAVTTKQELYLWGNNHRNQSLLLDPDSKRTPPERVRVPTKVVSDKFSKVKTVALSKSGTCIMDEKGILFHLGGGAEMFGVEDPPIHKLNKRLYNITYFEVGAKQISAGRNHFVFLTNSDNVYVYGNNKYGQTGGPEQHTFYPIQVRNLRRYVNKDLITRVQGSWMATYIYTSDGLIFEVGVDPFSTDTNGRLSKFKPKHMDDPQMFHNISSVEMHSAVFTKFLMISRNTSLLTRGKSKLQLDYDAIEMDVEKNKHKKQQTMPKAQPTRKPRSESVVAKQKKEEEDLRKRVRAQQIRQCSQEKIEEEAEVENMDTTSFVETQQTKTKDALQVPTPVSNEKAEVKSKETPKKIPAKIKIDAVPDPEPNEKPRSTYTPEELETKKKYPNPYRRILELEALVEHLHEETSHFKDSMKELTHDYNELKSKNKITKEKLLSYQEKYFTLREKHESG